MREKKERNKLIMDRIKKGDYQVDIARDFNISPGMLCKIKQRLMKIKGSKPQPTFQKLLRRQPGGSKISKTLSNHKNKHKNKKYAKK